MSNESNLKSITDREQKTKNLGQILKKYLAKNSEECVNNIKYKKMNLI